MCLAQLNVGSATSVWKTLITIFVKVLCFLLANSPASEFYMPLFQNTLYVPYSQALILHTFLPMKMEQSVPKRRHIIFICRGITQKKAYNIQNTAKV